MKEPRVLFYLILSWEKHSTLEVTGMLIIAQPLGQQLKNRGLSVKKKEQNKGQIVRIGQILAIFQAKYKLEHIFDKN